MLGDTDVQVTPNGGSAVDAEVRGRFFIARNVPLDSKPDNSIVASTSATTLADHSPSSDTVLDVSLDQNIMWSFSYNTNGDLALKYDTVHNTQVLWSYTYTVDGWLEKVVKQENGETVFTEEYYYDPIGRKYKIATTQDAQTTTRYFVYDGGSIILELEEVGEGQDKHYELEKEHVRGASLGGGIGGLLYTRSVDGSVGYFHYDGRGNVVSITDDSREEVAYYEYDAWGNILTACGSLANEFAFSTKQASLGTGLIDFAYRWYDPQTGRWTQRDPIGAVDGANLYSFALGRPPSAYDPWGADAHGYPTGTFVFFKPRSTPGRIIGAFAPPVSHVGIVTEDGMILEALLGGVVEHEFTADRLCDIYAAWTPPTQEDADKIMENIEREMLDPRSYDPIGLGLEISRLGWLPRFLGEIFGTDYGKRFVVCSELANDMLPEHLKIPRERDPFVTPAELMHHLGIDADKALFQWSLGLIFITERDDENDCEQVREVGIGIGLEVRF
jgi:RHS repeat-associated protein